MQEVEADIDYQGGKGERVSKSSYVNSMFTLGQKLNYTRVPHRALPIYTVSCLAANNSAYFENQVQKHGKTTVHW